MTLNLEGHLDMLKVYRTGRTDIIIRTRILSSLCPWCFDNTIAMLLLNCWNDYTIGPK